MVGESNGKSAIKLAGRGQLSVAASIHINNTYAGLRGMFAWPDCFSAINNITISCINIKIDRKIRETR